MPEVTCGYFPACRGCDDWDKTYELQTFNKLRRLQKTLDLPDSFVKEQNFISIQKSGLRHRFDFTFEIDAEQKMGFYDENRNLLDLKICLQLSPALQTLFTEFRGLNVNAGQTSVKKGSVRLRVSPSGQKGCWLDLANVDIKSLIDDSVYLTQLLHHGFQVEIGQKAKILRKIDSKLKLTDPEPQNWFQTNNLSLKSYISDFTQPSWLSAEKMVDLVLSWTAGQKMKSIIEFGPGIGQFTLPFLQKGYAVHAFENNPKAVEVLKINAATHGLEKGLTVYLGDFQNKKTDLQNANYDLVFVNPPRSGLKNFVNTVIATASPYCIYVSCFPESMKIDIDHLTKSGYKIADVKIVDQFPQTHHYEACVLLEKLN